MKEKISLEKGMLMVGMVLFSMWFRPFVGAGIWNAHLVPMGAPPVGIWWMFWALASMHVLLSPSTSGDQTVTSALTRSAGQLIVLFALWLGLV